MKSNWFSHSLTFFVNLFFKIPAIEQYSNNYKCFYAQLDYVCCVLISHSRTHSVSHACNLIQILTVHWLSMLRTENFMKYRIYVLTCCLFVSFFFFCLLLRSKETLSLYSWIKASNQACIVSPHFNLISLMKINHAFIQTKQIAWWC